MKSECECIANLSEELADLAMKANRPFLGCLLRMVSEIAEEIYKLNNIQAKVDDADVSDKMEYIARMSDDLKKIAAGSGHKILSQLLVLTAAEARGDEKRRLSHMSAAT